MYGSYGSYSSTSAMDIPSRSNTYHSSTHHDASCAFPSWPRRDSLTNDSHSPRTASSYISDEDLLFLSAPVFDEDGHSETSSSYTGTPSPTLAPAVMHVSDEDIEDMRREQALRQREYMAVVMREKEARRRARHAAKNKAAKGSRKAVVSPPPCKSKLSAMTPIAEAAE